MCLVDAASLLQIPFKFGYRTLFISHWWETSWRVPKIVVPRMEILANTLVNQKDTFQSRRMRACMIVEVRVHQAHQSDEINQKKISAVCCANITMRKVGDRLKIP